jgi:mevalonate kinase
VQGKRLAGPQSARRWASWGPTTGAGRGGAYLAVAPERAAEDLRRAASVAEEWP